MFWAGTSFLIPIYRGPAPTKIGFFVLSFNISVDGYRQCAFTRAHVVVSLPVGSTASLPVMFWSSSSLLNGLS